MAKEEKFYWIKLREDFFEDDSAIDYLMSQENGSDYDNDEEDEEEEDKGSKLPKPVQIHKR